MGSAARWKTIMTYSDYEKKLIKNVEEYGFQTTSVTDTEDENASFTYSIGLLTSTIKAEIIVCGLNNKIRQSMISDIVKQCKSGFILRDGCEIDDLLIGHKCIAKRVHPTHIDQYLLSAIWYNKKILNLNLNDVFQVFWPVAQSGQFPWEDDCDPAIIEMQPLLYKAKV